jgi:hypothetical protein
VVTFSHELDGGSEFVKLSISSGVAVRFWFSRGILDTSEAFVSLGETLIALLYRGI